MKLGIFAFMMFVLCAGCANKDKSVNVFPQVDYSIDQSRSCFCPQSGEPVRLFIVADTIADAVWMKTTNHLNPTEWQRFRSIKGLFDEIALWDSSSTFHVSVTYDSVYHYPSYVHIAPKSIIVNDTIVSTITDADLVYTTWNYTKHK